MSSHYWEGSNNKRAALVAVAEAEVEEALVDIADDDEAEAWYAARRAEDDEYFMRQDESELDALFGRDLPDATHFLWMTGADTC
jgi:hypothetical protein